ncbi:MAG: hypothetical protein ACYTDX_05835 [Planctomycetota bacterium]
MSSTGLIVTAALIAGGVGAGTALIVSSPDPSLPGAESGKTVDVSGLEEALAQREAEIDELRGALDELRVTVADLRGRPAAPAATGAPATDEDGSVISEPAASAPLTADQARFEEMYREVRRKEQAEDAERRLRNEAEGLRRRLERTGDRLKIPAEHHDAIVRIMSDRSRRTREVMREARDSEDDGARTAARERITAIREDARLELSTFLTAEQITSLERGNSGRGGGGRMNGRDGQRNRNRNQSGDRNRNQ